MYPAKTKIKELTRNRLKMNKAEIIEKIQYYCAEHMKDGSNNSKFIVITFLSTLGLEPKDAHSAFDELIKDLPKPYKEIKCQKNKH